MRDGTKSVKLTDDVHTRHGDYMKIYLFILTVLMLMIAAAAHAQCTWIQQHAAEGLHYYWAMDFSDTLHGWVGRTEFNCDQLLRTTDGGKNWITVPFPEYRGEIKGISFVDTLNGWYASPGSGSLYRTRDGGLSWNLIYEGYPPKNVPLQNIRFLNTLQGWSIDRDTAYRYYRIARTSDGGLRWQSAQITNASCRAYAIVDTLHVWFVGNAIMKTADGGLSWQRQSFDTVHISNLASIYFIDTLHGWAASDPSDYVVSTNNGGNTWLTLGHVDLANSAIINNIQFLDTLNGWVCGTSFYYGALRGIVYKTTDGGKTWSLVLRGVSEGFEKIKMFDRCHGWLLSHDGTIMALDPTTGIPCESFIVPESISLSQNFPNPFNPNTTIIYKIAGKESVLIELYDELGKKLSTLINETKMRGEYSIEFNSTSLSSGIYFYRLTTQTTSIAKKMVVIK